ncbi:MAG: hypothetical protein IJJ99_09215 [Oscillospiraceae bacterium]|nr:hypothetical protein [Oscillospiraceae bacterium]
MKKLLSLLLCCALTVCLLAACGGDPDPAPSDGVTEITPADIATEATPVSEASELVTEDTESHAHVHVNYKGLETGDFTLDDVVELEGRQPDLTYDVDETTTLYIYNNVTLGDLLFTQVQFSFNDDYNRISCTCGGDEEQSVTIDRILQSMTAQFGEPTASDDTYRWGDGHNANFASLTALNETTVQLVFYFYASEGE